MEAPRSYPTTTARASSGLVPPSWDATGRGSPNPSGQTGVSDRSARARRARLGPALRTVATRAPPGRAGRRADHSVAPTTTATALTSISTGTPPGEHGVVGYRMYVHGEVLNVLRWSTAEGDARRRIPPEQFQHRSPFRGTQPVAVTKAEFAASGFTLAHLAGVRHRGWRLPSTLIVEAAAAVRGRRAVRLRLLRRHRQVAHEYGLGAHYDAELAASDRLVADAPGGASRRNARVGHRRPWPGRCGDQHRHARREVLAHTRLQSGEGRFRWLHAQRGREGELLAAATTAHSHHALGRISGADPRRAVVRTASGSRGGGPSGRRGARRARSHQFRRPGRFGRVPR